jgi:hypothetical protein
MTEDRDEEAVTAGEFHELADTNLANALFAQGVDPDDPSAGRRELSLSQYALLSIATSLREIAKLQSELNDALGRLAGPGQDAGTPPLHAEVVRRNEKEGKRDARKRGRG